MRFSANRPYIRPSTLHSANFTLFNFRMQWPSCLLFEVYVILLEFPLNHYSRVCKKFVKQKTQNLRIIFPSHENKEKSFQTKGLSPLSTQHLPNIFFPTDFRYSNWIKQYIWHINLKYLYCGCTSVVKNRSNSIFFPTDFCHSNWIKQYI